VKTLIIVILASWILYRAGVVHRFLNALIIPDLEPVPDHSETIRAAPDPVKVNPDYKNISRLELEQLAIDRMKNIGIKHWYIIARTAPNDVLLEWIEL
jgi:hypothetical protein